MVDLHGTPHDEGQPDRNGPPDRDQPPGVGPMLSRPGGHLAPGHSFRYGGGAVGIERLAAALRGEAFAPHRHDRYAIGVTLAGVQTFRYRGARHHCLPGQWHVLHPDELHDGAPGTDEGFGYRIIYLDPALVQNALGGEPLPFVAEPVIRPTAMPTVLRGFLANLDEPLDEVTTVEVTTVVADLLRRHSAPDSPRRVTLDLDAMWRVRTLLTDDPTTRHRAEDLEVVAGLDRWSVARQFRAAFGTSPTRYRTMRQLDLARRLIRAGHRLAEVAAAAGFADQAHLTRMFKQAYGLTPAIWAAALRNRPLGDESDQVPPASAVVRPAWSDGYRYRTAWARAGGGSLAAVADDDQHVHARMGERPGEPQAGQQVLEVQEPGWLL